MSVQLSAPDPGIVAARGQEHYRITKNALTDSRIADGRYRFGDRGAW
jgi:hypothetical protein